MQSECGNVFRRVAKGVAQIARDVFSAEGAVQLLAWRHRLRIRIYRVGGEVNRAFSAGRLRGFEQSWGGIRGLANSTICLYLLRQRRDLISSLGHRPRIQLSLRRSAESAIQCSVPGIPLVEIDAVPAQQFAVIFLKRVGAMVLWLRLDVLQHSFELTRAHGKRTVPMLPEKTAIASVNRF